MSEPSLPQLVDTPAMPTTFTTLDTTGLLCPEPVMLLHQAIRKAKSGDCIQVLATDPSTQRDIPKFCLHLGHTLLKQHTSDDTYTYWIVKKSV